jgi:hypothetical protein
VGGGSSIHVEPSAPYLGSLLTSDDKDDEDVALRTRKANGMFGSLQKCLFKQKGFSSETKLSSLLPVATPSSPSSKSL